MISKEFDLAQKANLTIKVAYIGNQLDDTITSNLSSQFIVDCNDFDSFNSYISEQSLLTLPDAILLETDTEDKWVSIVKKIKSNPLLHGLIIVIISSCPDRACRKTAMDLKVHDFYAYPFPIEHLSERLSFLVRFKLIKPKLTDLSEKVDVKYHTPILKRFFDVVASGLALILLSPFLLLVAICIRLESKGAVIYKSKRVGTGYKVFDFYKFRSMRPDADKMMKEMALNNQYAGEKGKSAFVKIKNDPRVTRIGNFIRNTSIDELPQLINVLKGDMSLVGNRPLPLYEAEQLTSNEWSMRFLGPAGLTGLWQISKRGKEDMSERERKKLDNFYALRHSFWLDLRILLGTFPALLQKEKV